MYRDTSSVDCAPRELTHACSGSDTCSRIDTEACDMCYVFNVNLTDLIMPPISKDCSNTFLERSFIYAAPCEWNKLSEHIRISNFDCFRKSVKTMLFTQQYGCSL